MIEAVSITSYWYTPESERDSAQPTRFHIRPLTGEELEMVLPELYQVGTELRITPAGSRTVISCAILNWENFNVEYKRENFKLIPRDIRQELVDVIVDKSFLSETERKNSLSQSRLSGEISTAHHASGEDIAIQQIQPHSTNG